MYKRNRVSGNSGEKIARTISFIHIHISPIEI